MFGFTLFQPCESDARQAAGAGKRGLIEVEHAGAILRVICSAADCEAEGVRRLGYGVDRVLGNVGGAGGGHGVEVF